jgi:ribosomal protein L40E
MTAELVCWKCGAPLGDIPLPLSRFAECKACHAKLHVCRMCEFYDTSVAKSCREPVAEEVKDKTRANFCDYFKARPGAYSARDDAAGRKAASELESLFGLDAGSAPASPSTADEARRKLDELFKK